MPSPVTQLMMDTFPSLPTSEGAEECWVAKVLRLDLDALPNLQESVELLKLHSQLEVVKRRLQNLHPVRKAHKSDYDRRVLDCLTEVLAFGWGALQIGNSPIFTS